MTTPCAASKSFCARRMLGFCRRARLTASASESGWGMKVFVPDEGAAAWSGATATKSHARVRHSRAGWGKLPDIPAPRPPAGTSIRPLPCPPTATCLVLLLSLIGIAGDGLALYSLAAYTKVHAWRSEERR